MPPPAAPVRENVRDRIQRAAAAGFFAGPATAEPTNGWEMTMRSDGDTAMAKHTPIGASGVEQQWQRVSRWMSILYVVAALATPALLYFGPDVLSPAVPAIANAALDGRLALHPNATCKATPATATAAS